MLTVEKARLWLRLDAADFDPELELLIQAATVYIETATGMTPEQQAADPLAETVAKFLLSLWFDQQYADKDAGYGLQRGINSLLKALTLRVVRAE